MCSRLVVVDGRLVVHLVTLPSTRWRTGLKFFHRAPKLNEKEKRAKKTCILFSKRARNRWVTRSTLINIYFLVSFVIFYKCKLCCYANTMPRPQPNTCIVIHWYSKQFSSVQNITKSPWLIKIQKVPRQVHRWNFIPCTDLHMIIRWKTNFSHYSLKMDTSKQLTHMYTAPCYSAYNDVL